MSFTKEDEWLVAIVLISVIIVVAIFAWMIVIAVTYNRRSQQRKDILKIVSDTFKRSNNGNHKHG